MTRINGHNHHHPLVAEKINSPLSSSMGSTTRKVVGLFLIFMVLYLCVCDHKEGNLCELKSMERILENMRTVNSFLPV